jgi:RNA polymerase sigma factor (sigma-70 family)
MAKRKPTDRPPPLRPPPLSREQLETFECYLAWAEDVGCQFWQRARAAAVAITDEEEIRQLARLGLERAVRRYQGGRRAMSFRCYAWHMIRFRILDGLRHAEWFGRGGFAQGYSRRNMRSLDAPAFADGDPRQAPFVRRMEGRPDAGHQHVDDRDELDWVQAKLPAPLRETFELLREGRSVAEVADQLGICQATVRQRTQSILRRARRLLGVDPPNNGQG